MAPRRRRILEKIRSLYLWHRYAGLVAALLVTWLAVTGILLNHTEDLDLTDSYVQQDWLLEHYSIRPAGSLQGYQVSGHWITGSGELLYIDRQRIHRQGRLVAAAETGFGFVLAFPRELQLYTGDAVLVESLPFTASPAEITGLVALASGELLIDTARGQFLADPDITRFTPAGTDDFDNLEGLPRQELPAALASDIAVDIRRHTLDWERVLLDLHSGRFFGLPGKWLADFAAVLVLLLAITGVVIWFQRWRSRQRRTAESR